MAGYVIHLAVAEEYLKKFGKDENYDEFIEGVIAPDDVKDKSITHFGKKSSEVNLKLALENMKLESSYERGYFLHLVTDYLFYNKFFDTFSKEIYNDYDCTNKYLIEKYGVKLPARVADRVYFKQGDLVILDLKIVENCIDAASSMDVFEIKKEILDEKNYDKWLKIRELKFI